MRRQLEKKSPLAAGEMGYQFEIAPYPDPSHATLAFRARFQDYGRGEPQLFQEITQRVTNRRIGMRKPIKSRARDALTQAAAIYGWGTAIARSSPRCAISRKHSSFASAIAVHRPRDPCGGPSTRYCLSATSTLRMCRGSTIYESTPGSTCLHPTSWTPKLRQLPNKDPLPPSPG